MAQVETIDTVSKLLLEPASRAVTTEIAKYLFSNLEMKIKKVFNKRKISADSYEELAEKFSNYLEKSYIEYSSIPTLALKDKRVSLNDIYESLTLKEAGINDIANQAEYTPLNYDDSFFESHPKLIIFDTAGMGKSTFLKFLFLSAMQQRIQIPIFIELRHLKNDNSILDEIYKKINYLSDEFNKENILELIKDGDFIFFLDGYDEISRTEREKVSADLKQFLVHANKNRFIITSRPDAGLNLATFEKYKIRNLKLDEAVSIIRKYDNITGYRLQEELIETIKSSEKHFNSFLKNPMFVSLLYVTYKNKRELPLTQASFYRTVYDALYSDHDLTKDDEFKRERGSDLSRDELEFFFQKFAYYCFTKDISNFEFDSLLNIINEVLKDNYFSNKNQAYDIFVDITQHVPLLTKDGVEYKWIHKSFLEYFTAKYISIHVKKTNFLQSLMKKELSDYENMLKIYVDIDRSTFDSVFVEPLLNSFLEHVEQEPQTGYILKLRERTFLKQYVMTQVKKDMVDETLSSVDGDQREASSLIFDLMRQKCHEKYDIYLRSQNKRPARSSNGEYENENMIGSAWYTNTMDNNVIIARILKEKNYPFIQNLSKEEEKARSSMSRLSFFNNLNLKEDNMLLISKNTFFKDSDINLRDIYLAIISIRRFSDIILSYSESADYLTQMRKQDEDFLDLWN
ncbi:NACHT domain-containing protein [Bacillus cereus]|uniref:NACHT domain-containing protein n=1 Tax=Bacillus cereus TaxID=1396 RepID=UPI000B4B8E70|nr:NACHT domain-containing protein [Bacillus cereus]